MNSVWIILILNPYIWNCGKCEAGKAIMRSRSLHADKYKDNQAGLLCACRPFWELTTHRESNVERRFKWELFERNHKLVYPKDNNCSNISLFIFQEETLYTLIIKRRPLFPSHHWINKYMQLSCVIEKRNTS